MTDILNINLGGISDSDLQGSKNSVASIVGLDIHSEPGYIKASQKLTKESDTEIDEVPVKIVPASNGKTYIFGGFGTVWERNSAGEYTERITGSGAASYIYTAEEFDGFLYYTTPETLERFPIGSPASAGTFTTLNYSRQHTLEVVDNILYVGNGKSVLRVQSTVSIGTGTVTAPATTVTGAGTSFTTEVNIGDKIVVSGEEEYVTARASDTSLTIANSFSLTTISGDVFEIKRHSLVDEIIYIPNGHYVDIIKHFNDKLYLACSKKDDGSLETIGNAYVYVWNKTDTVINRQSTAIAEFGVNAIFPHKNTLMINAGKDGNLFMLDGRSNSWEPFKKLKGDWHNKKAIIKQNATMQNDSLTLFGVSNVEGNPITQGVYSIGGYSGGYPDVFSLPYVLSAGTSNLEVTSMAIVDSDTILVGWHSPDFSPSAIMGIDIISLTTKYTAGYFETRTIRDNRLDSENNKVYIPYKSLPTGTSVQLYVSEDGGSYRELTLLKNDKLKMYVAQSTGHGAFMQFKAVLNTNADNSPVIEGLIIHPDGKK